jgi:hypothetical protein
MNHVGREGWRPRPRRSSVPRRRTEASDRKSKEGRMNRTSIGLIAEVMAFLLVGSAAFSQTAGPGEVEGLGTSEELVNKSTYVEGHQFTFILSTLSIQAERRRHPGCSHPASAAA